jgi:hypothetical protein
MAKPTVSYITNMIIRFILTALGKQLNYKAFSKKNIGRRYCITLIDSVAIAAKSIRKAISSK